MATVAKSGTPSISSMGLDDGSQKLPALIAGEDIAAGDACYVKSDGLAWRTNGTSANAAAKVRGFAPTAAKSGEPIALVFNVTFNYGSGLTPGVDLFASATAGALDNAATTGGTAPVGFCVDASRVYLFQSTY